MENDSDHFLSSSFVCHDYDEEFDSKDVLAKHTRGSLESSPKKTRCESSVECPICLVKFTQRNNLGRHMQRFHGAEAPRSYLKNKISFTLPECPECEIKFTRRSNLLRHQKKFHEFLAPKLPQQPKIYSCTVCDTKFTKWRNCLRHMRKFHPEGNSPEEKEEDQPLMDIETECISATEDENMEYVIEVDPYPVISPPRAETTLLEPTDSLESESRFENQSQQDSSTETCKSSMKNNSKFMCDECSLTFSTPFNLRRHRKRFHEVKGDDSSSIVQPVVDTTKTKKSPLGDLGQNRLFFQVCAECNISFSTTFNMRRHMKRFHQKKEVDASSSSSGGSQQTIIDTTEIKKCPLCDFHENRLNLYVHFNLIHGLHVIIEYQVFDSEVQLDEWLSQVKTETQFMVRKSDPNRMVISCSMSKDDNFCPAEMIILTESGKCTVHSVKTHVGHES